MEYRFGRSSKLSTFPPSPLQRYLATPRYKPTYQRRSFQYVPRSMHRVTYLNGQRAKLYNTSYLYPEVENPEARVDLIGKKNQLLLITRKRYGSAHDLSSPKKSSTYLETPTSHSRYSSHSMPTSPFPQRSGFEPYRSYSYQELYSPRSPSTPRRPLFSSRRTYSTSDLLSSSPSSRDRYYYDYPPFSNYRRWTSNYDISYIPDHYSSVDALYGYRKAGSCDVLYPPSPSYFDFRPFSRSESGYYGYEFRSRSGSGSILRSSRSDYGEYRAATRSECDFPVRDRGPSSKAECGISPNDIATRSESGFSISLSDFDTSFTMPDDETGSVSSVDPSLDKSIDNLLVFPLDIVDHDRLETDSVVSHDRTLDIINEDENSDQDQENSRKPGKSSVSVSLLSRFEQADRHSSSSQQQKKDENDDEVVRQHTDTIYFTDGANTIEEDASEERQDDENEALRQHTDTIYFTDGANTREEDASEERQDDENEALRQHTDTIYFTDGANTREEDASEERQDDENDDLRQHTDTVDLFDGTNKKEEEPSSSNVSHSVGDGHPSSSPQQKKGENDEEVVRQHTDTIYFTDGANTREDASQERQDEENDVLRQHTDTMYLFDGANRKEEGPETDPKVNIPKTDHNDDLRQHTDTLYLSHVTETRTDESPSQGEKTDPMIRHHTDACLVTGQEQIQNIGESVSQVNIPQTDHDDDLRQHTDTLYLSHVTESRTDESRQIQNIGETVSQVNIPKTDHDDDLRQHTDTLYLSHVTETRTDESIYTIDTDEIIDDPDSRKLDPVGMEEEEFRQQTETIQISQTADSHRTGSLRDTAAADVRNSYIHNTESGGDLRQENMEKKKNQDSVKRDNTDEEVLQESGDEGAAEESDEDSDKHRQIVQESDESGDTLSDEGSEELDGQHRKMIQESRESADDVDVRSDEELDKERQDSDDERDGGIDRHRQIVYVSDEQNIVSDPGQETREIEEGKEITDEASELEKEFEIVELATGNSGPETIHDSTPHCSLDYGVVHDSSVTLSGTECEDRVDLVTVSGDQMETADFEYICVTDMSSIEKSDEFEIIESKDHVFTSTLIGHESKDIHELSNDMSEPEDITDGGCVYSHNISAEYEKVDHEAWEAFIDEREITTSSQVHLAEEDTDSNQSVGQRSDDEINDQSSDNSDSDLTSSHRQLTQSGDNPLTEPGDKTSGFTDSVSVNEQALSENELYDSHPNENRTDVKTDKAVTDRANTEARSPQVIRGVEPGESLYAHRREMDWSDTGDKSADKSKSLILVSDGSFKSPDTHEDESTAPVSLSKTSHETEPKDVENESSVKMEIDEKNSSRSEDVGVSLAGKKGDDSLGAEVSWARTEDNPIGQKQLQAETADRYSWSASQSVGTIVSDNDGEAASSRRETTISDRVQEKWSDTNDEKPRSEGYDRTKQITRHDAKMELPQSEKIRHVFVGEESCLGRESIDTCDPCQHTVSATCTDADSRGIGNSQQLLETENVDYTCSPHQTDHGLPVPGGREWREGEEAVTESENINRDEEIGGTLGGSEKNSCEEESGAEKVGKTDSEDVLAVRNSCDISVDTGYLDNSSGKSVQDSDRISELPVNDSLQSNRDTDHRNSYLPSDNIQQTESCVAVTAGMSDLSETRTIIKCDRNVNEHKAEGLSDDGEEKQTENVTQINKNAPNLDTLHTVNIEPRATIQDKAEQSDILNVTGGVLHEPTLVESDNECMQQIYESSRPDLNLKVDRVKQGSMAAEITVKSAAMQVTDTADEVTRFTDRTESTLPVDKRAVIHTRVQYRVKKLTKTVTKTDVDVKKVQKKKTGDSVEHEHLRKVEQLTVVSQKVWSSTESLDKDEPLEEKCQVAYRATFDTTKDKDGCQLPSAHYETSYTGEIPINSAGVASLRGESEDILALCGPDAEQASSSVTSSDGTVHVAGINISPELKFSQRIKGNEQKSADSSDMTNKSDTESMEGAVKLTPNSQSAEINDKTKRQLITEDDGLSSSSGIAASQHVDPVLIGQTEENVKQITLSTLSEVSPTQSGAMAQDNSASQCHTDRIEIFLSPKSLSPVTVRRKRWSAERQFTDDKLICTLYEDTVSDVVPARRDSALYILEDNLHLPQCYTDRQEQFVTPLAKSTVKVQAPVIKPLWTFDLSSLIPMSSQTGQLDEEGDNKPGRVVSPHLSTDSRNKNYSESDNTLDNIRIENSDNKYEENNLTLTEISAGGDKNDEINRLMKSFTITSITHTSEMYDSDTPVNENEIGEAHSSEASVRSLPSTSDSKQVLTGNGDGRSWEGLTDTADVGSLSELPETDYTSFTETERSVDDGENYGIFLDGGLTEHATDRTEQFMSTEPGSQSTVQVMREENIQTQFKTGENIGKLSDEENVNNSQISERVTLRSDVLKLDEDSSQRDPSLLVDSNSNIVQVKNAENSPVKQVDDNLSHPHTEDKSSLQKPEEFCQTVKEKKTDLTSEDERNKALVSAQGSYPNKIRVEVGDGEDLSSGAETNSDSLLTGPTSTFLTVSPSVGTPKPGHTSQINTHTAGCEIPGDNDSNIFLQKEATSGGNDQACDTEDIQPDHNTSELTVDIGGHAQLNTRLSGQPVYTSIDERRTEVHGSEAEYKTIETGDSIDDQHSLSTPAALVDSASITSGSVYSGHTEVGKLNAGENKQNSSTLESAAVNDGMLINSRSLVERHAEDQKYANVTRALDVNEFSNVSIVSELETFGGSGRREFDIERAVTVTCSLDISHDVPANIGESDNESSDYDRDNRIKEFSEAFIKFSTEELPLQLKQRNDESISERRGRLTSVTDAQSEEPEYSNKMSHLDYDDWTKSEAAQEQLRSNRSTQDGLRIQDNFSLARMEDITSSSDEINRSKDSDTFDRLDWLESQVHTENTPTWQKNSSNVSVLVTGQVDSDMEENNNFEKQMDVSYAEESDNSDLDTSGSQYSATVTCELKDGQRSMSPTSLDERFMSVTEHMFGEFRDLPEGNVRLTSSASSDGYFSSASDQMTGELRLNQSSDAFRHYSSTSSEGYQSFISDQMTGELKTSPSSDKPKQSASTEFDEIEDNLQKSIQEFESLSETLAQQENDMLIETNSEHGSGISYRGIHIQQFGETNTSMRIIPGNGENKDSVRFGDGQAQEIRYISSGVENLEFGEVRHQFQDASTDITSTEDRGRRVTHNTTSIVVDQDYYDDNDHQSQVSFSQGNTSLDYLTDEFRQDRRHTQSHFIQQSGTTMFAQTAPDQSVQRQFESVDLRSGQLAGQGSEFNHHRAANRNTEIQYGGIISGNLSSEERRHQVGQNGQNTQFHPTFTSSTSDQSVTTIRNLQTSTRSSVSEDSQYTSMQEKETYENVPESVSEIVKDELLKKSHGYFSSSVSVNLSKKWKMFEKLWHSFDEFSWKGNLAPHLFTFVFQKSVENQTDIVDQFEQLYPLLLIEDVERCQNHICTVLYTDEYLKQRKMQKYFLRGFTKDLKCLWHAKRKQSLAPLCNIPEDRIVSFSDCASVSLPTCHTTSIHPSLVSFQPVSKPQFNRFIQQSEAVNSETGGQEGDNSFDSGGDNSADSLQYICQGDLSDPTIMLSERLRDLSRGDNPEILDDVLLRGLRHYRSKFMRFNPYYQKDPRKGGGRKIFPIRNETIYEEEEDERYMD